MSQTSERFGLLAAATAALTLVTASAHLYLGIRGLARPLNVLTVSFLLNGLGYLALLATLNLPIPQLSTYHHLLRQVLMGFAALTVAVWVVVAATVHIGLIPLAYVTKVDELLLIGLLLLSGRQAPWRVQTQASR
jgi:hypothetical protein